MIASPLAHFLLLDHRQQIEAVKKLAASGASDHEISRLTGVAVEAVRRALIQCSDDREASAS